MKRRVWVLSLLVSGIPAPFATGQENPPVAEAKCKTAAIPRDGARGITDKEYLRIFLDASDLPAGMRMTSDARKPSHDTDTKYRDLGGVNGGFVDWTAFDLDEKLFHRISDGRWVFPSDVAAEAYLADLIAKRARDLPPVDDAPAIGTGCRIFGGEYQQMVDGNRLRSRILVYLLRVRNVVVEFVSFVSGPERRSVGLAPLKVASIARKIVARIDPDASSPPPTQTTRKTVPELVIQEAHSDYVRSVAFSPDSGLLASVSNDGSAKLWDLRTGLLVRTLIGPAGPLYTVDFRYDRAQVAGAGMDRTVHIWEVNSGQEIATLKGHSDLVKVVAYSPSGKLLASGGEDNLVAIWELRDGTPRQVIEHKGPPLAFRPEEHEEELKKTGMIREESLSPKCLAFSRDDKLLAVGAINLARVYNVSSGQEVHTFRFEGDKPGCRAMAFSPNGRWLAVEDAKQRVHVMDVLSWSEVSLLEGIFLGFLPQEHGLVTVTREGLVRNWDAGTGRLPKAGIQFGPHGRIVQSPDGRLMAGSGSGNTVPIWDAKNGAEVRKLGAHGFRADAKPVGNLVRKLTVSWHPTSPVIAFGGLDGVVRLYDLRRGGRPLALRGHRGTIDSLAFRPDGEILAVGSTDRSVGLEGKDQEIRLWNTTNGKELPPLKVQKAWGITAVAFAPNGRTLAVASAGPANPIVLWNTLTWEKPVLVDAGSVKGLSFARNGRALLVASDIPTSPISRRLSLFEVDSGRAIVGGVEHPVAINSLAINAKGDLVAVAGGRVKVMGTQRETRLADNAIWLYSLKEKVQFDKILTGHSLLVHSLAFSPKSDVLASASGDGLSKLWDVKTGQELASLPSKSTDVGSVAFSSDERLLACAGYDQSIRIWDVADVRCPKLVATLLADGENYVVMTSEGRFDTDDLLALRGLSWLFPDDPFRPLPPEIFMRDYYEPRLLPRILSEEKFHQVRPLAELNRVQPEVLIARVEPEGSPESVRVLVEVAEGKGEFQRDGRRIFGRTGSYDLRLFRDGHLVGRWPEPASVEPAAEPEPTSNEQMDAWRQANRIALGLNGKATHTFTVRLPHREAAGPVEFTAYAFNEDRVKSATARATYDAPARPLPGKPRAYLVCMGVGATEGHVWDLAFAAADARLIAGALGEAIVKAGKYEVVPILLTSERRPDGSVETATATKANFRAALDLLAGREVDAATQRRLPSGDRLRAATPDDVVLLSFSGHGYTDAHGALYLLPFDVGASQGHIEHILGNCVSTAELSAWLRGVDAGELALVVDACHSAAAVQQPGFKPGPLGSRGLGQLAYDKGMRVLAASQADDVAVESYKIKQGLLTYALVKDGLEQRRAAHDGVITMGGLMKYAADRVSTLYREVLSGEVKDASGTAARNVGVVRLKPGQTSAVQRPELFDYDRNKAEVILNGRLEAPGR